MSGHQTLHRLACDIKQNHAYLDHACKRTLGVTASMFRTAKFVYYIATLVVSVYLIQIAGVAPTLAMGFAVLLISGPEALESWLIHQGKLESSSDDTGD